MRRLAFLYTTLIFIAVFGVLHWSASLFYFYWRIWWFDILMHFMGGLCIGLLSMWFLYAFGFLRERAEVSQAMFVCLVSVLIVGVGWEVFETIYDIADPTVGESYELDTSLDLLFDLIGASVAALLCLNKIFYKQTTQPTVQRQ